MYRVIQIILITILSNNLIAQVQYPDVMPKDFINKIFCGHIEVYAIDFSGNTNYSMSADFDYKITISETEGIYVEYNPGQRWHDETRNGTTQKITKFVSQTKKII